MEFRRKYFFSKRIWMPESIQDMDDHDKNGLFFLNNIDVRDKTKHDTRAVFGEKNYGYRFDLGDKTGNIILWTSPKLKPGVYGGMVMISAAFSNYRDKTWKNIEDIQNGDRTRMIVHRRRIGCEYTLVDISQK
ncbi:hypothetical protein HN747_02650 [archaeon]|jgi:hypothetical protein|nr:hypothetical protein [archaeon]